jgi:hypothetical protein
MCIFNGRQPFITDVTPALKTAFTSQEKRQFDLAFPDDRKIFHLAASGWSF